MADAAEAVGAIVRAGVVPSALELIDAASLGAVATHLGRAMAPAGTAALLIVEVDGNEPSVRHEAELAAAACQAAGPRACARRPPTWSATACGRLAASCPTRCAGSRPQKINHDLVVPRGRVPELFALVERVRVDYRLLIAAFGHAGDGNIHVNLMVHPGDADEMARAAVAERALFTGVIALDGSITGEHGVGFAKAAHLRLQLSDVEIALMARLKQAFDPHGVLNPGKIWDTTPADVASLDVRRS